MLKPKSHLLKCPAVIVAAVVVLILGCNVVAWILWEPRLIMDDGVQYLSSAANWLAGNGFSTNALIYEPHFQGKFPAPQTVWPPGLPALQVLLSYAGIELKSATLLINLLVNLLAALVVYLILKKCEVETIFAIACALIFYLTARSWVYIFALISEPLFSFLILAALYCLPASNETKLRAYFVAGLFVAASIYTRYSGVLVAASFTAAIFFLSIVSAGFSPGSVLSVKTIKRLVLFSSAPILAFVSLLLRTQQLTGGVERRTGVLEGNSFYVAIESLIRETSELIGFRIGFVYRGDLTFVMFVIFLLILVSIFILAMIIEVKRYRTTTAAMHLTFRSTVIACSLLHAVVFVSYLIYANLTDTPINITPRYLYQVYPGLFVIVCLFAERVWQSRWAYGRWLTVALASVYLVTQFNLMSGSADFSRRGTESVELVSLKVNESSTLAEVIDQCVGRVATQSRQSLWSNDAVLLHLNTGVNTISLAETYATENFNYQRFQQDIKDYQIKMFVFINYPELKTGLYGEMLGEIENWLQDNQYRRLQMQQRKLPSGVSVDIYMSDHTCLQG